MPILIANMILYWFHISFFSSYDCPHDLFVGGKDSKGIARFVGYIVRQKQVITVKLYIIFSPAIWQRHFRRVDVSRQQRSNMATVPH